jgi:uncharacterized protein (DUF427 family)
MTDNDLEICKGTKYLVRITEQKEDTIGVFKGYSMMGSETVLVMEMSGGKLRYIPVEQISYLDLLESGAKNEPEPKKGRDIYYG